MERWARKEWLTRKNNAIIAVYEKINYQVIISKKKKKLKESETVEMTVVIECR